MIAIEIDGEISQGFVPEVPTLSVVKIFQSIHAIRSDLKTLFFAIIINRYFKRLSK